MPTVTIEELTAFIACAYLVALFALGLSLYLLFQLDAYRQKKRKEKFKQDIADEVCSRVLGADYVDKKH